MLVTLRNIIRIVWQLPRRNLIALIDLYQATLSPDHGLLKDSHPYGFCRLHPTCSAFARHAILEKGALYGSLLSLQRILSCTPWKAPSEERIMEMCYGVKNWYPEAGSFQKIRQHCGHRIMAITSGFQPEDAGSIPTARSIQFTKCDDLNCFDNACRVYSGYQFPIIMPRSLLISSTLVASLLLASCIQTPSGTMPPKENSTSSSPANAMMTEQPDHILLRATEVTWQDAPPVLPAGAKIAVLEGDPSKPGPFTLRLQFPANYRVAPHSHPAHEHVTILSGTFALGMGETFDESALTEIGVGGFAMMRTGTKHFAFSRDGATIQLHGIGPWGLTYVNPADDPRTAPAAE